MSAKENQSTTTSEDNFWQKPKKKASTKPSIATCINTTKSTLSIMEKSSAKVLFIMMTPNTPKQLLKKLK